MKDYGKYILPTLGIFVLISLMTSIVLLVKANSNNSSTEILAEDMQKAGSEVDASLEDLIAAAEQGDLEAQFRLGRNRLLEAAFDASKATEAVMWLTRAAEAGHSGAMTRLGSMYQKGMGVLQNFELALTWIERATRQGDPEAMLELGRIYRDGIGVDKDLVMAYVWFNRAAAANNYAAAREREVISMMLDREALLRAQRLSVYETSARQLEQPSLPAETLSEN